MMKRQFLCQSEQQGLLAGLQAGRGCKNKFTVRTNSCGLPNMFGVTGLNVLSASMTQGSWQWGSVMAQSVCLPILPDYSSFLEDHLS